MLEPDCTGQRGSGSRERADFEPWLHLSAPFGQRGNWEEARSGNPAARERAAPRRGARALCPCSAGMPLHGFCGRRRPEQREGRPGMGSWSCRASILRQGVGGAEGRRLPPWRGGACPFTRPAFWASFRLSTTPSALHRAASLGVAHSTQLSLPVVSSLGTRARTLSCPASTGIGRRWMREQTRSWQVRSSWPPAQRHPGPGLAVTTACAAYPALTS